MPLPFATMTLAPVVAFMMFAFPRTPAAIMPALPAFPRPIPAPGTIGGRVGVWNRSRDEAARQDRHGHHDPDPRLGVCLSPPAARLFLCLPRLFLVVLRKPILVVGARGSAAENIGTAELIPEVRMPLVEPEPLDRN